MNKEATEVSENNHHLKVFLPKKLVDCVPKCPALPKERLRWNTNEEIASYLITFEKHEEWLSCSPKTRPQNGSMILYNRKKVKYRKDGYCWKKRKDGKTTREDHMKLKVKGLECLYGCYVHSSIFPTFHRRCYWLLQNPDIVLVHYLNVPALEDCGKLCGPVLCSINSDRKEWLKWSKEELVGQLKPMFHGIKWSCGNGNGTAEFSIEQLVQQILESHQAKPPPRTHACLCSSGLGSPSHVPHKCSSSTKHRIISPKGEVRPPCPFPAPLPEAHGVPSEEAKAEPEAPRAPSLSSSSSSSSAEGHREPRLAKAAPPDGAPPDPGQGFPKQELPAVSLSVGRTNGSGALLVMAGLGRGPEKPLALTPSQQLLSRDGGHGGGSGNPPATPLGLALLLGPGLVLSQNLDSSMETAESGPTEPDAAFDPDCFLNSPKEGETYGGGAKPEPPPENNSNGGGSNTTTLQGYSVFMPSTNRFFIQDDGGARPTAPALLPPSPPPSSSAGTEECKSSPPETPMETTPTGGEEGEAPGDEGPPAEMSAAALQEELYSMIQTAAVAATASPSTASFGLSFDNHFPDLIGELMTDESGAGGGADGATEGNGSGGERPSPGRVLSAEENLADETPGGSPQQPPLASITDFSPEWSYPEGGVKVLITGPWVDQAEPYSCLFDQISVPAALIQSGVLRCYCPAHEAGLVPLHVACESRVVSLSVLFEYRARNFLALPSTQMDWLSLDDNQFRMSILERLEQMEKRMAEMTANANAATSASAPAQQRGERTPSQAASDSFEDRIVALCEKMMAQPCWLRAGATLVHHVSFRGMTLLHLAAAQGYTRLIQALIRWRNLNVQSLDLEQEVDPLNVDHFSCTPLMWACALGHLEAAQLLFRWNRAALSIPDSLGRLPLSVARSRGHVRLASRLEELQRQQEEEEEKEQEREEAREEDEDEEEEEEDGANHNKACATGPRRMVEALHIPSPLSASPDTGLSTASSVSSPSELSEGSVSVTSAYSSGSTQRESPAYSPEEEAEGAMDVCPGEEGGLAGWYLREGPHPAPPFFMDCDEGGTPPSGHAAGPPPEMEPELLSYAENVENEEYLPATDVLQVDMITLAKQIIEATPERIKQEDFASAEAPLRERPSNLGLSETMSWLASYLENVDQLSGAAQRRSLASASSSSSSPSLPSPPLPPPAPSSRLSPLLLPPPLGELSLERLPPPPSAASWAEFLNASANGKMESDFALLTLSDHEQRELYEAAKIIQTAFRKYKGRRLKEQQEMAAAVIQRCYRKYKQLTWIALKYALYKKMTQAAILIQSKFRSYYEQKKFQQSRRAAVLIQQYYRSYKEYEKLKQGHRATATAISQKIKGNFLTKKQDQAARKIMRFLRRCRHRMKELKQRQEVDPPSQKRGLAT